jgi:outer membrane protein OmpA-like peptidoglycan-associated protein
MISKIIYGMMLSNDFIKLIFICSFLYTNISCALAVDKKEDQIKKQTLVYRQEPDLLHTGSYLVIGVFEYEKNARRFANKAIQDGLEASYKFHANTGFFYVYTHSDSSKTDMLSAYHHIRNITPYNDAWIFTVQDTHKTEYQEEPFVGQGLENHTLATSNPDEDTKNEPDSVSFSTYEHIVVVFEVLDPETGDTVNTDIRLVDGKRAQLIENLHTNHVWVFNKKDLALDTIQVIAQAIGYRKFQMDLNVSDPQNDTTNSFTSIRNDTLLVQLPLTQLEVGDIQVMYNTYFYGNSTVMRIQSKYELEEVYKTLKRSPTMKIKLHGHTNGNSRGLVYLYLEEEGNFFELVRTKEYQKRRVSSVKLSADRAETIKSYLVHRGIAPERIETMGWGGKQMLYDPDSPLAKNNIRVEIEVLNK